MKYKFLEHTADIKFQAFGKTLREIFKNSAMAFKKAVCGNIKIKSIEKKQIKAKGKDFESLMYNFLEEILYFLDAEDFLIGKVEKLEINEQKKELLAVISGDKASNYKFTNSIKAVTYNEMFVRKEKGKWVAQVVLDA